MKYILFVFITLTSFAQNPTIKLEIDSVTFVDSIPTERIFTINYHIENLIEKPISFIVNTKDLLAINLGSQSYKCYFKLFEEQKTIEMSNIFTNKFKGEKTNAFYDDKTLEEIQKASIEETVKYFWEKTNKNLMKSIVKIQPKETKNFQAKLYWDKERYRKQNEFEYYIDEKATHYIELSMNLLLEEFKDKLTEEQYSAIINDKTFIKGWYTSNKTEINFKE
jgi:hypothetical protein